MSLLAQLASQLRATGERLPLPQLARARQEVDSAIRLLAAHHPHAVRRLGAARGHLDAAAGALLLAQDAILGYVTEAGIGTDPDLSTVDGSVPVSPWAGRVADLTRHQPSPVKGAATSAELLDRALERALTGDRAGFADVLAAAEPAVGYGLAALTAPMLERLVEELLGRPASPADRAELLDAAPVRGLLPGLGRAPWANPGGGARPGDSGGGPEHPADAAITGVVLVAALLQRLGRPESPYA